MAESSDSESSEESEYSAGEEDPDEQYDPTSEKYNALRALYYPDRAMPFLPAPDVRPMDNLSKYASAIRGITPTQAPKKETKTETPANEPSTSQEVQPRFLPHQEPVKGRGRKAPRNVMTRMQTVVGPLAALKDAMEKKIRVKVVVRGRSGWGGKERNKPKGPPKLDTRGELHGSVCAFDRHWNIAMEDVTEVFRRRTLGQSKTIPNAGANTVSWPADYKRPPKVTVLRREHRYEVCERYLGQVMVRGEQVALVAIS